MNLLIVDRPDSWHVKDLRRAAGSRFVIETAAFGELSVDLNTGLLNSTFLANGIAVKHFDAILTRAMPASSLEQIVFRMDWLNQVERQLCIPVINPARTIESSVDKYLSLEQLREYDIPIPATHVSQTARQAKEFFHSQGNDTVVKPIFGSRGRNIIRLSDADEADRKFLELETSGSVIYQQEFIEHGDSDLRILVVGDQTFGMQRTRKGHWVTNASLGAQCTNHQLNQREHELAIAAAHSQNAYIAGIDLLYDNNEPIIVEVNACPAWRSIAATTSTDLSRELLALIENLAS